MESLEDGLTNKQRLEEIEEQWSATRDLDKIWLITRVKKLTEALEFYAGKGKYNWFSGGMEGDGEEGYSGHMGDLARKALKESE